LVFDARREDFLQDRVGSSDEGRREMRVALVCDWLTNVGGAEKLLLKIHNIYPDAPIYTSKYDENGIDWFREADVRTGWMQVFPTRMRRLLGPIRQWYFSHLDLSEYDVVISVTGAEAKSVKSGKWLAEHGKKTKNPQGIHISYCHVPTQYYWQMYNEYMKDPGFGVMNLLVRPFFRLFVKPLRRADLKAARRVDYFVTISDYAKDMIKKCYGREAVVIHPPVEFDDFAKACGKPVENFYIVTSRQVNWKKIDLAVRACEMTQRRLVVIGEGPEHKKLVKMAKGAEKITFLPLMKKKELASWVAKAKGYLFPSMEPFGIAPVEALAAGCPVIAFGEGGARDYVQDGKNGLLFDEQTAKSLAEAILEFEKKKFNREKVSKTVKKFAVERFDRELLGFVKKCEKKNAKKSKK
jgi:glycosyltransferase involved in cell wall biosynthesis